MAGSEEKKSLYDVWIGRLKNHPAIATLLLLVVVLTGIASITDSITRLTGFFHSGTAKDSVSKTPQDLAYEAKIIGSWRVATKVPAPTGVDVKELRYTFLSNGSINWWGSYTYKEIEVPILLSGKWNLESDVVEYVIQASNVPLIVQSGYSASFKIIQIDDEKMTYIDLTDGIAKTDLREPKL